MTARRFRFGVVAGGANSGKAWLEQARRIESLGFDTLVVPDGLGYTPSPFAALAAVAAVTSTLRVGTYVIDNDYRHPVMLAKEAATVDHLSGGRFELGIGAGRPSAASDNAMLGVPFDSGGTRVERLAESLSIIKPLLAGETVDHDGRFYTTTQARILPAPVQQPIPIMVAASQKRLMSLAARHADVIALGVGPDASQEMVAERIAWVRDVEVEHFSDIVLNINFMAVAGTLPRYLRGTLGDRADALTQSDAIPVLKGSVDEMCDRVIWLRERFGISYFMVGEELIDAISPVVKRLSGK